MDVALVVLSVVVTFGYGSIYEWVVHRFLYHPATVPAMARPHAAHHEQLYPFKRYFEKGTWYRAVQPPWLETAYLCLHLPLFAWLGSHHLGAGIGALASLASYAVLSHYVHPMVHMRSGAWWEHTWLFKNMLKRHVWHHWHQDTNYNIVLPLGDWLFGTAHDRRAAELRRVRTAARPRVA